ncbi:MAG TPA: hypothetical protein VFM36_01055 [Thermoanaerobaculia bacterium]|nr:hypothetical protein [Thermoanaerobaculia bacterium]
MKKALFSTAVLLLVASMAAAAPAAQSQSPLTLPISGSFTDAAGGVGSFDGTFKLVQFVASGNVLLARGYVSGTLTDSLGRPVGSVMKSADLPVSFNRAAAARTGRMSAETNAVCDVLNLVLGPLHLDLLGLTVDLNQVVLDINAETGSGNLLGNLLCAVVSLLDGAGSLVDIAQLLNRILEILGGLLG